MQKVSYRLWTARDLSTIFFTVSAYSVCIEARFILVVSCARSANVTFCTKHVCISIYSVAIYSRIVHWVRGGASKRHIFHVLYLYVCVHVCVHRFLCTLTKPEGLFVRFRTRNSYFFEVPSGFIPPQLLSELSLNILRKIQTNVSATRN